MGKDTIRLEDVLSTISQEYLLDFTSEYGIPESLHPKLPGPEEPIMDFSEGKVGVYTKFFKFTNYHIDLFNLISSPNPTKVKTETRPRTAHEVSLLTATVSRVIDMEDTTVAGGIKDQVHDGLSHRIPPVENPTTIEVVLEPSMKKEMAAMGPHVNKKIRKRGNDEAEANAPSKVLRKDHTAFYPTQSTLGGKSLALLGLDVGSTFVTPVTQDAPTVVKSVSDQDPLSYMKPQPHPELDISPSARKTAIEVPTENVATAEMQGPFSAKSLESGKSTSFPSMDGSPGGSQIRLRFEQELRLLKKATAKIAKRDQRIQAREEEIKRLDQEIKSLRVVEAEVYGLRILPSSTSHGQGKIKAAFEEFKKYEDDRVEQYGAKMDARLDKLSVDFNKELYPPMLTAIMARRWVIGHDMCLAVMKCAESPELRHAFADVVFAGLVKCMSVGLTHGIEHGKVCDLEDPWVCKEEMLLEDAIVANKSQAKKRRSSGWFVVPMGLVPLIMPDPTASSVPPRPSGEIVSDNGKQFSDNPFKHWCDKLNITQRFASVKHPRCNGLVERANRSLCKGIKALLGEGNKNLIEELPHVLWAHRTMIKSSHGDTPFSLTYGTKAVISVKIRMPTYRAAVVDTVHNNEELRLNSDLLEERRERVAIHEAKAKLKMTKYCNARV
nr:reverse transcriptase domain-containing protein [Tanacetum cinerariifolium]